MGRLSKLAWFALATHVAAAACVLVALVKSLSSGIEGAYFSDDPTAPGTISYVTSFDPVPWLAAAIALLIVGTVAFVVTAKR
jgi:hypothetical protein